MGDHVDAGEIEQRLYDPGRAIVPSVESLIGQQPRERILDDVPDGAETGAVVVSAPPDDGVQALSPTKIAVESAVISGISEDLSHRRTDCLGKLQQMRKHHRIMDVGCGGDGPKRRAICQRDDMIFCAGLAAICGIWTDKSAAVLGSHTATVDHKSDRFDRGRGTGSQRPNERTVNRAQGPHCKPPSHPSPQSGTADTLAGGGEHSPSHPFVDKVTESLHDLSGFRARVTRTGVFGIQSIDQGREEINSRRSYGFPQTNDYSRS